MTTEEAFIEMMSKRGIHNDLGVDKRYVSQLRDRLKNGKTITIDLKMALLIKAGWVKVVQEDWARLNTKTD